MQPLERKCAELQKFAECVEATLDFDAINEAGGVGGRCVVNPNFDDTLRDLKDRLDKVKEGIERSLDRYLTTGFISVHFCVVFSLCPVRNLLFIHNSSNAIDGHKYSPFPSQVPEFCWRQKESLKM